VNGATSSIHALSMADSESGRIKATDTSFRVDIRHLTRNEGPAGAMSLSETRMVLFKPRNDQLGSSALQEPERHAFMRAFILLLSANRLKGPPRGYLESISKLRAEMDQKTDP
jgi:hypothetical protein